MPSLYIHIPFCKSKCLFCSFVIAVGKENRINSYLESLSQEAGHYRGTILKTLYIGGGTPSHMNIEQIKLLGRILRKNFKFNDETEFNFECNPEGLSLDKAKALKAIGINRASLGVQSLNEKYLKFLGRNHNRKEALDAFLNLRKAGFLNINLDLMFCFPDQTLRELKEDVDGIASLGSEHLSLYNLTIEEGSRFYRLNLKIHKDETQAKHYLKVIELLEQNGFEQYEISNFAKPGKEALHNHVYWQGRDYIGLGVGAHSHIQGERFWNVSDFNEYLVQTKSGKLPIAGKERLDIHGRLIETFLFGLRMKEGVDISSLEDRFDCPLSPEVKEKIGQFVQQKLLTREENRLKTTLLGRLVLDELCARLI